MKQISLFILLTISSVAFAHRPLSQTTVNAMNMIQSSNVRACISQLNSRHSGDFLIFRATLHEAGTNSEYHLFGGFLEGGDMVHGSAHLDVKVGLLPPFGPGYQCRIISEHD